LQGNFGPFQKLTAQMSEVLCTAPVTTEERLVTPPATVVIPAGSSSGSPPVPWKAPGRFGDVQVVGGMWEWVGVVPAEGTQTTASLAPAVHGVDHGNGAPLTRKGAGVCRLLSGFSAKKSMVSLAEWWAAGCAAPLLQRGFCPGFWVWRKAAVRRLVSGCCGSPWAADRPTSGRFRPTLW